MSSTLSKRFLKTVSFLFSIGLWLHLVSSQEMTIYKDVLVEYDVPSGMSISSKHATEIRVELKGPKAIVRNYEDKNLKMKVKINNLKKIKKNSYKFLVDPNQLKIPFGVSIVDYNPKAQDIKFSKKLKKKIPLVLGKIKGALDLDFLHQSIHPKEILVEGPESIVKKLNKIKVNAFEIDPSVKNGKVNVTLNWPDERVKWSSEVIYFSYISEFKDNKKTLKKIPITFTTNIRNFDASANTVTLTYLSSEGLNIDQVKVSADLTPVNDNKQHEIDLKVDLPDEFQMIKISPKTIKVRLK
jgi:hypothetical protein